ncbi:winged helix-turn-helix transcriptional regulator [Shimazuella alba]|uniref:Transcriptional regulator n=1 Tax=Shimazuella alba TaxID=2690964 RepID=A0A6I4VQH8_9BACL|nr:transcriptional regulator [Shimazuella alba]
MENFTNKNYNIPAELTLDIIGGKWKTITLCHLTHGPKRSGELMKLMPVITRKMLTQSLRELEADGLISRTVFEGKQLKVIYELTELGLTLQPVLQALCNWGENMIEMQNMEKENKISNL